MSSACATRRSNRPDAANSRRSASLAGAMSSTTCCSTDWSAAAVVANNSDKKRNMNRCVLLLLLSVVVVGAVVFYDNDKWTSGSFVDELGKISVSQSGLVVQRENSDKIGIITINFNGTVRQSIAASDALFVSASLETTAVTRVSVLYKDSMIRISDGTADGPQRFFVTVATASRSSEWQALSQQNGSAWVGSTVSTDGSSRVLIVMRLQTNGSVGFAVHTNNASLGSLPGVLATNAIPFSEIYRAALTCDRCTLFRLRLGSKQEDVTGELPSTPRSGVSTTAMTGTSVSTTGTTVTSMSSTTTTTSMVVSTTRGATATSDHSASTSTLFVPSPTASADSIGPIIGAVCGTAGLLLVVGGVVWWSRRSKVATAPPLSSSASRTTATSSSDLGTSHYDDVRQVRTGASEQFYATPDSPLVV